jgi:hypothetical protein
MSEDKKYTIKELEAMASIVFKNTPASTTATGTPFHGPLHGNTAQFGIFSNPGVRPERWSTLARPWSLASILTPVQSVYWQEKLEIMTGQTAGAGDNASNWCDDPPTPGENKVCQQIFSWGDFYMKGKLNVLPYIGQLRDRADVPAEIINAGPSGNPYMPDLMYQLTDTQSQVRKEIYNIGIEFERGFDVMLVQGNAAATIGQRGWFNDFTGLDLQIKTGYTDAVSGLACSAMDSAVETFGGNISGTSTDGTTRNIVQMLGDLYYGLTQRASKFGMSGTRWVIVMREELFKSFVDQYSCLYNLYSCSGSQYEENNIDQMTTNQLRLQMYNGRYLLINGVAVPVVFTEGIAQTTPAANTFESDMYIVPVNYAGRSLLNLEYFPMSNQYLTEFSNAMGGIDRTVMNNGMWLASVEETAMCKELHFGTRMRLILETPFLAGRIDNLQYSFNAPIRNALPGASFYSNGGITYRG